MAETGGWQVCEAGTIWAQGYHWYHEPGSRRKHGMILRPSHIKKVHSDVSSVSYFTASRILHLVTVSVDRKLKSGYIMSLLHTGQEP